MCVHMSVMANSLDGAGDGKLGLLTAAVLSRHLAAAGGHRLTLVGRHDAKMALVPGDLDRVGAGLQGLVVRACVFLRVGLPGGPAAPCAPRRCRHALNEAGTRLPPCTAFMWRRWCRRATAPRWQSGWAASLIWWWRRQVRGAGLGRSEPISSKTGLSLELGLFGGTVVGH